MCNDDESSEVLLELVVSAGLGIGGRCPRGKPVLCVRELSTKNKRVRTNVGPSWEWGIRTYESIGSKCDGA